MAYVKRHCRCIGYDEEQVRMVLEWKWQLDLGNKLRICPFGREPKAGSCFYLGFNEPLPTNTTLRVLVDIFDDYKSKACSN